MIQTDKALLITTVGRDILSCQSEEPSLCIAAVNRLLLHILIDHLHDLVLLEICSCNKQCILQIHLILLVIAFIRELCIAKYGNLTWTVRGIGHLQIPYFISLVQRNIIECFGMNVSIICLNVGISCTMMTLTLIVIQVLAYRLPGSRPVILRILIS